MAMQLEWTGKPTTTEPDDPAARRIVGAVSKGGKRYAAGDEAALATVLPRADIDRLAEAGVLAGDWSQPAATPDPADTAPETAPSPPAPPPTKPAAPVKAPAKTAAKKAAKKSTPKRGS